MKKLNYLILLGVIVFFISCQPMNNNLPSPVVVTLQPDSAQGKDAMVEDYPPYGYNDMNFGNSVEFAAISWTANGGIPFVERSFINFNFDTIPSNATIDSARLSLYAYEDVGHGTGHSTLGGTNECFLQRVTGKWEENTITWNNQPPTTTVDQVVLPESDSAMQNYLNINVTNLVRDIHENMADSYGFMLRLEYENAGYRRMFFASSDVPEAAKRPKLVIYYTLPDN